MRIFRITKQLQAICSSENTRYGFRHLARLQRNYNEEIAFAKCCYYNRTWESFEFQTVLSGLLEQSKDSLSAYELKKFKYVIAHGGEHEMRELKSIAGIAALGNLFCSTTKESNDWKTRMLKAGLENKGLHMPEDWNTLDEATKQARLDAAIASLAA